MRNSTGNSTVRLALLGAGRIGQVHAKAIAAQPKATLVAVADAFPKVAEAVAQAHGCAIAQMDAIERDKTVDAVIICTPTDTHADLIERFVRAGKAVFCEKPIDLDAARVRGCLKVVAENNGQLMVGFNRRFDASFQAMRRSVDDGTVGDVELVQITSRDPSPPPLDYIARSGGLLRDMMIHDFDMVRFLLGEEPVWVSAHAACLVDAAIGDAGDVDTASVVLETESGRQATITNSRRATYGYDQRVEVFGSKGMAQAHNQRPTSVEISTQTGSMRPPVQDFFMSRYAQAYETEIGHFVTCLMENKAMDPTGEDGLKALLLADAAYLSLTEKRRVHVSEVE
ncbi:MAG: inositol 2-dehydrogenase [Pseudomonadota bacterium]